MALNISKFACMAEFSLELPSLGAVRCLSLNTDHLSQAHKKLGVSGAQRLDVVRWLFGEMARRPIEGHSNEDKAIEGACFATEALSSVTDDELEEFANKLIQKNNYLLKTYKGGDIEKSADESACDFLVRAFRHHAAEEKAQRERMMKLVSNSFFTSSTAEAMQRNLDLSNQFQETIAKYACGHPVTETILAEMKDKAMMSGTPLASATLEAMQRNLALSNQFQSTINKYPHGHLVTEAERIDAKVKDIAKAASSALHANAAAEAIQHSLGPSNQHHDAIAKLTLGMSATKPSFTGPMTGELNYRLMEPPLIPKSPIHETNEKLGNVVEQIEGLRPMAAQAAQLIRSMNDTALRMQADYINNASIAGRQTKIAIGIAVVSLVITSFFSYQSYADAKASGEKADAQIKAFQNEIRDLVTAQHEERAAIVKAIVDARHASAAVKRSK